MTMTIYVNTFKKKEPTQKRLSTGLVKACLFTFFYRLAQAEKCTKTKGFDQSCNQTFLL